MKVFGITDDLMGFCQKQNNDRLATICRPLLSKFNTKKEYEGVVIPPYGYWIKHISKEFRNIRFRMLPKGTNIKEGTLKKSGEGLTIFARYRRFAGIDGGKARDQVAYLSAGDRIVMINSDSDHNVFSAYAKFFEIRKGAQENREALKRYIDEQANYKPDDVRFTTLAKKIDLLKKAVADTKIDYGLFMTKLNLDPFNWLLENTKVVSALVLDNVNIIVAEVLDSKLRYSNGLNNAVRNWFEKFDKYLLEWYKNNHDGSVKTLNKLKNKIESTKTELGSDSVSFEAELNLKAIDAILQADENGDNIVLSYIDIFAKYLDSLDAISKAYDLESFSNHNAINEAYVMNFEPCTTFPKSDDVVINRFDSVQPLSPIDPQKLAATISSGLIRSKDKDMGIGKDNIVLEDGTLLRFSMMQKETVSQSTLTDSNQKTVTVREVFIEHVPTCCVFDPFIKEANILRI